LNYIIIDTVNKCEIILILFSKVIGIGWEINNGETRYGGLNDVKAARKYYPHIRSDAMDKVEPYLDILKRAWQKVYNSK
jgi:hypothetical protein